VFFHNATIAQKFLPLHEATMTTLGNFELRSIPSLFSRLDEMGRRLGFNPQISDVRQWQTALRAELSRLLGEFPRVKSAVQATSIETTEMPDFTCELLVLETIPGEFMPCYVLTPHHVKPPYKPVLALHGHGTWGAKSLVGLADTPAEAAYIREYKADYGAQIARAGYRAYVPALRGFGDRMEDRELQTLKATNEPSGGIWSCQDLGLNALLAGQTLMGLRVWDVLQLIDFIDLQPDVQREQLPCVGLSGGGTLTMYATALDQRITAAYISGAINTFRDSIMSIPHCVCNYIPHLPEYAEMPDVAGLIAPRPLMVENGDADPIYPAFGVEKALVTLRQVYAAFGVPERLTTHTFKGQHRWDGEPLAAWLAAQYL
jgi:dienelactone hydrolase